MSLARLASDRSGGRPLLINDTSYATTVVRQGNPIPWSDVAELAGHFGQTQSLLDPDAVWVDVGMWLEAQIARRTELVEQMGQRPRRGFALRALLADDDLVDGLAAAMKTIEERTHTSTLLNVPSPVRLLTWAHSVAGTPLSEVDEDAADAASIYLAEWLGRLTSPAPSVVVLDAGEGSATGPREQLSNYTSISNVAGHVGWSLALRDGDNVTTADSETIAVLPQQFWISDAELPSGDVLFTTIPASASPETVLEKLALLRSSS